MLYHHRHHNLTSCKARVEHLHLLQKNDPPPSRLDGKPKNHKMVHIPPTKNDKTPHVSVECVCVCAKKYQYETRFLCAQCAVPLHPEGCYIRYHMLKH